MTTTRWSTIASLMLIGGSVAWLAKQVAIAATATNGVANESGTIAVFYLLGWALLLTGATGVGLWLTRTRRLIARASAVVLSPVACFACIMLLDSIGKPLVGARGPAYLPDEVGIIAMAVLSLVVGLWLFRTTRQAGTVEPGAAVASVR